MYIPVWPDVSTKHHIHKISLLFGKSNIEPLLDLGLNFFSKKQLNHQLSERIADKKLSQKTVVKKEDHPHQADENE